MWLLRTFRKLLLIEKWLIWFQVHYWSVETHLTLWQAQQCEQYVADNEKVKVAEIPKLFTIVATIIKTMLLQHREVLSRSQCHLYEISVELCIMAQRKYPSPLYQKSPLMRSAPQLLFALTWIGI